MARVLQGETLVDGKAELLVERPDGQRKTVMAHPQAIRNERGEVIGAINCFYDITERKLTEERTRASEAQLAIELADMQRLQRISSQLIQEGDLDTLYVQILEAAIQMMGADMGSMQMLDPERNELRLLAWRGFDPASAAFWETVRVESGSTCGVALSSGKRVVASDVETTDFMAGTQDLDFYRLSGIRAVQSTPLVSRDGCLVGMISTHWREPHQPAERDLRLLDVLARQVADLIERTRTEELLRRSHEELAQRVAERTRDLAAANSSLRRLSQRILEVQEGERRLIAQELHDEIGQALTGVKMMLETLESAQQDSNPAAIAKLNSSPDLSTDAPHLGEISATVAHALEQVRDLSLDLRPAILDSLGLLPALEWQFERYTNQTGVQVDFSTEGLDHRLPTHLEAGVYRLIQEALTNVARYAGVSAVIVHIYVTEERLLLYVVDEGTGFNVEEALDAGVSTGLAGMRERADLLGGTLTIDSIPGEGTTIQVDLSITQAIDLATAEESEQEHKDESWQTTERDAARDKAGDHQRDLARDSWRDRARDAKRDTARDAFRDLTRDALSARQWQREQREQQDAKNGKDGKA
jgi:signal transduction histidine kinase